MVLLFNLTISFGQNNPVKKPKKNIQNKNTNNNVASKNNISKQDEEDGIWGSFGRTQSIEKLKRISRECLYCGKKLTYGNIFYITSQGISGSRIEGIDCQDKNKNLREYNDNWSMWYNKWFCCKICIRAYHRDNNIELRD